MQADVVRVSIFKMHVKLEPAVMQSCCQRSKLGADSRHRMCKEDRGLLGTLLNATQSANICSRCKQTSETVTHQGKEAWHLMR